MYSITFWQYFKINKQTSISCLKISAIIFTTIATLIALGTKYIIGEDQNPFLIFIYCELYGQAFALFIFILALLEGYVKAQIILRRFNKIPHKIRDRYAIHLMERPLNPKYWFLQYQIVQIIDGQYYEYNGQVSKEIFHL